MSDAPPVKSGFPWVAYRWPLVVVLLAILFSVVVVELIRVPMEIAEKGGEAATSMLRSVDAVAEKFKQGTITETFLASLPELNQEAGGLLELVTTVSMETFRSRDELKYNFKWFELSAGETITEIRVPVTYRYHLRLHDPWELTVSNQVCVVRAPAIRPSIPPAIHTDKMEKFSDEGWARFNVEEQMSELEKSITPELSRFAKDETRMDLIRESCRKTVADFVRDWLLREQQWSEDRFHAVKVYFSSETEVIKNGKISSRGND